MVVKTKQFYESVIARKTKWLDISVCRATSEIEPRSHKVRQSELKVEGRHWHPSTLIIVDSISSEDTH